MKKLFELNPDLDRAALAKRFAETSRVQIRDVLTEETAREMLQVLTKQTPWGMAIGAGEQESPKSYSNQEAQTPQGAQAMNAMARSAEEHSARGEYAFRFAHYPIVKAVQDGWDRILSSQLDSRHRPCNFVELMPRLRES